MPKRTLHYFLYFLVINIESKDKSNVIIAIDINDKKTDREPNILKENGLITVIEVCITSTKEMMTDTKLIKDNIKVNI